jgi:hypothetical protein
VNKRTLHRLRCIILDTEDSLRGELPDLSECDLHLEAAKTMNDAIEHWRRNKRKPSEEFDGNLC